MNEKKPTNPWTKSLFIWMGIILLLVFFVQSIGGSREAPGKAMAYSDFVKQVDEGNVKSISIAATQTGNSNIAGVLNDSKTFKTVAPKDANVSASIGETSESMTGRASPRDLETMFQLLWLRVTAPRADSAAFAALTQNLKAQLRNMRSSPEAVYSDTVRPSWPAALSSDFAFSGS